MSMQESEMNFCRRCGGKLTYQQETAYTCANGHTIFLNSAPGVGIFFLTDNDSSVLLSERGIEPNKGGLDSFGGFLSTNENFLEGLQRELREELSLEPDEYETPKFLTTAYGVYPYENEAMPLVAVFYWSRLKTTKTLVPSDDVAAVVKRELHALDFNDLHAVEIRDAVKELQNIFENKEA